MSIYPNSYKKVGQTVVKSAIKDSGNSDVDVDVNLIVDTTPLAYAIACFLHSTGKISDKEFTHMIKDLKFLIEENKRSPKFSEKQNSKQTIISDVDKAGIVQTKNSAINNPKNNTVSQKKSNAFNKGNQNVIWSRYFDPNKDLIKGKFAQYHY